MAGGRARGRGSRRGGGNGRETWDCCCWTLDVGMGCVGMGWVSGWDVFPASGSGVCSVHVDVRCIGICSDLPALVSIHWEEPLCVVFGSKTYKQALQMQF